MVVVNSIQTKSAHADQPLPPWLHTWQSRSLQREAITLPSEMYYSPDIYRLEQQAIFGKSWYYVGHTRQLNGAGSYFTVEIAEQPLVILLDKQGKLGAFYNICTHRAGPVATGHGACHRLTCLYHAWSFDLDGTLRSTPDMEAAEGFDRAAHALTPVQVDQWECFIFVNLDLNAAPLAEQLGELPDLFQRYRFANWARVHSVDYWTDTNWKLYVENNTESYHEPTVHPILRKYYKHVKAEARHRYYLQVTPLTIDDDHDWTRENPDLYAPGLSPEEMDWASTMSFFPNFAWIVTPACTIIYLIDPQGPCKTRVRWDWLVPDTEAARSPENLDPLIEYFDNIQQEDLLLFSNSHYGTRPLGFSNLPVCK